MRRRMLFSISPSFRQANCRGARRREGLRDKRVRDSCPREVLSPGHLIHPFACRWLRVYVCDESGFHCTSEDAPPLAGNGAMKNGATHTHFLSHSKQSHQSLAAVVTASTPPARHNNSSVH